MTERDSNTTQANGGDDLDAALRGWAGSFDRPEGETDMSSLVDAINQRLETPLASRVDVAGTSRIIGGLAIAASLLFMAAWGLQRMPRPEAGSVVNVTALQDEDISRQRRLVRGVYDLFGDRLSWLVVSPEGMRMGVDESSEPLDGDSRDAWRRFTGLRLVVVRRQETEEAWETVRELDVLAPLEQLVALDGVRLNQSEVGGQSDLRLWSFLLPDGGVAIDIEGALPVFGVLESGSHVLQPGAVTTIAGATADGWQYRLLQTAVVVDTSSGETGA